MVNALCRSINTAENGTVATGHQLLLPFLSFLMMFGHLAYITEADKINPYLRLLLRSKWCVVFFFFFLFTYNINLPVTKLDLHTVFLVHKRFPGFLSLKVRE